MTSSNSATLSPARGPALARADITRLGHLSLFVGLVAADALIWVQVAYTSALGLSGAA